MEDFSGDMRGEVWKRELHLAIDDFYVTHGGGIENGEDVMQAIEREENALVADCNSLVSEKGMIVVKHWHGAAPDSWFSHLAV